MVNFKKIKQWFKGGGKCTLYFEQPKNLLYASKASYDNDNGVLFLQYRVIADEELDYDTVYAIKRRLKKFFNASGRTICTSDPHKVSKSPNILNLVQFFCRTEERPDEQQILDAAALIETVCKELNYNL